MSYPLFPVPDDENWDDGMLQPSVVVNTNARRAEVMALPVIDFAAAAPGSPVDGELFVVTTPWLAGVADDLAYYYDGAWTFWLPFDQLRKFIAGDEYIFIGGSPSGWVTVMSTLGDYADDAAATIGGVEIGGAYRTGSIRKNRVS